MPLRASQEALMSLQLDLASENTEAGRTTVCPRHPGHRVNEETGLECSACAHDDPPVAVAPTGADPRAAFSAADVTIKYMLAGNAIVTFESQKTGTHFTFQINVKKNGDAKVGPHFVKVLTRPDFYEFLGTIFEGKFYRHGSKSRISDEAKSNQAFMWAWKKLSAGIMPDDVMQVFHEGRCGRCGRRLTDPTSVSIGLGPTCRGE
jgi:Family of unknown function (DUF6011)